jgi:hypothetical protein
MGASHYSWPRAALRNVTSAVISASAKEDIYNMGIMASLTHTHDCSRQGTM